MKDKEDVENTKKKNNLLKKHSSEVSLQGIESNSDDSPDDKKINLKSKKSNKSNKSSNNKIVDISKDGSNSKDKKRKSKKESKSKSKQNESVDKSN